IDLGIIEGNTHYPQISYENFLKDEIVLVSKSHSKLAKLIEITPKELLTIPLILREPGSGTLNVIFKSLTDAGINTKDLQVEIQMESNISIKRYLEHADGAAFLSMQSIVNELKRNELSIIEVKGLEILRDFQFIQLQGHSTKLTDLFKRFCHVHASC